MKIEIMADSITWMMKSIVVIFAATAITLISFLGSTGLKPSPDTLYKVVVLLKVCMNGDMSSGLNLLMLPILRWLDSHYDGSSKKDVVIRWSGRLVAVVLIYFLLQSVHSYITTVTALFDSVLNDIALREVGPSSP